MNIIKKNPNTVIWGIWALSMIFLIYLNFDEIIDLFKN